MMAFILATDFDFIACMSKIALSFFFSLFFWKLFFTPMAFLEYVVLAQQRWILSQYMFLHKTLFLHKSRPPCKADSTR